MVILLKSKKKCFIRNVKVYNEKVDDLKAALVHNKHFQ